MGNRQLAIGDGQYKILNFATPEQMNNEQGTRNVEL
jgi:hypothetical protein